MSNAATMPKPEIQIKNVGPIRGVFKIDFSTGPGAYELQGGPGVGKSTTLDCVADLIGGHTTTLTITDGELGGSVEGFGVVCPVASKKRSRGELEINSLDIEHFAITDITDPPYKNEVTNDAHRLKALASLFRVRLQASDFYALVGGQEKFESLVRIDKLRDVEDPVAFAKKVKAELETAARLAESKADTDMGHAEACQARLAAVDAAGESDATKLNARVDAAVRREAELSAQAKAAARAAADVEAAQTRLKTLSDEFRGKSAGQALAALAAAQEDHGAAEVKCVKLEADIAALKAKLKTAEAVKTEKAKAIESAKRELEGAQQHERLVEQCRNMIRSQQEIAPVPDADVKRAAAELKLARAAAEQGVRIRDALEAKRQQQTFLDSVQTQRTLAEGLRGAAKGTFDILAAAVKLDGITIESPDGEPRLVVQHPNRPGRKTYFGELSDGERQKRTIDLTMPLLGQPAIYPITQRAWQDLSELDQADVHAHAQRRGVYIVCAKITSGPLKVRYLGGAA